MSGFGLRVALCKVFKQAGKGKVSLIGANLSDATREAASAPNSSLGCYNKLLLVLYLVPRPASPPASSILVAGLHWLRLQASQKQLPLHL